MKPICLLTFAALCSAGTIVVPGANASTEGTGLVGYSHYYLSGAETTTQAVIPAALMSGIAIGSQITGMAFRADSSAGPQPGSTDVWTSFDVIFAEPSATFSLNFNANFANNLGPDATAVRSGSLSTRMLFRAAVRPTLSVR